jgi:uncharacterized protein (TIGR02145 family)
LDLLLFKVNSIFKIFIQSMKKIVLCCFLALGTLSSFNTCYSQTERGVLINGVIWARTNVAAPGTFAANPEDAGMFYQWNSKVAWPAIGDIGSITATDGSTTWNSSWTGGYTSPSSSDIWTSSNDPSPAGWRVPTLAEIETLLNTTKIISEWTIQNSVYGRKFTDKTTGNSIFLPASGCRYFIDGMLYYAGSDGYYWSRTASTTNYSYHLGFKSSLSDWYDYIRAIGLSVRSVAK